MKSIQTIKLIAKLSMLFVLIVSMQSVYAAPYVAESLSDATVYNDFVVGPSKYYVELAPGQSKVINMIVTNRLGEVKDFEIRVEDFVGSRDGSQVVSLVESGTSLYSLKNYIHVASSTFTIGHAQRVTIPVTISVLEDAQPGGLYGSVVVGTTAEPTYETFGQNPVLTRIGALFFVRVSGEARDDLVLKSFGLRNNKKLLTSGPVDFQILYENNGNVHENPQGNIEITNIFGTTVANMVIEPWFVMPNSLRNLDVRWDERSLFGKYTATVTLEKGYGDLVDSDEVTFYVLSMKAVISVLVVIAIVIVGFRILYLKLKGKKQNNDLL